MKGLLIKDLELTMLNAKRVIFFGLFALMFLFTGNGQSAVMSVAWFSILCGMFSISSIAYDEFDHSNAFLMTLPVSRETYAGEKHLFSFLCLGCGWMFSVMAGTVFRLISHAEGSQIEWWLSCGLLFLIFNFMFAVMIPVQLKFGAEQARAIMVGMVIVMFAVLFGIGKILEAMHIDIEKCFNDFFAKMMTIDLIFIVFGVILLFLTMIVFCVWISINIMKKKQF